MGSSRLSAVVRTLASRRQDVRHGSRYWHHDDASVEVRRAGHGQLGRHPLGLSSVRYASSFVRESSPRLGHAETPYNEPLDALRRREYPHMSNGVYLDHSGTTIYARSTVDGFTKKMTSTLYGNPHSANEPARISGEMVDDIRAKALRFLGADSRYFDLIFVANATAGIKLVADAFRDLSEKTWSGSFWYGYHKDSHTSLVGVRELTKGNAHCFRGDGEVDRWLMSDPEGGGDFGGGGGRGHRRSHGLGLFAYPGQSNMSGRRLPLAWPGKLRAARAHSNTYSLLDAAALAMTSPMRGVFADPATAPDFTCLSFYKIFGFPDLGGLVVRRDSGHLLTLRKYFGGGTVTMVSAVGGAWHKSKGLEASSPSASYSSSSSSNQAAPPPMYSIHDGLEDGTLPFHSILALGEAIDVHARLFGSMENVSRHTTRLAERLYAGMASLRHPNGRPVCQVYCDDDGSGSGSKSGSGFGDATRHGATVAFNVLRRDGSFVPYSDVEEMANTNGIYIRSGGICCPGGMFTALGYEPWELERAMSAGHHCGPEGLSLINQLPTGVVRASLGPMSTPDEVDTFVSFLRDAFVSQKLPMRAGSSSSRAAPAPHAEEAYVEEPPQAAVTSFG